MMDSFLLSMLWHRRTKTPQQLCCDTLLAVASSLLQVFCKSAESWFLSFESLLTNVKACWAVCLLATSLHSKSQALVLGFMLDPEHIQLVV
jgi:hypothetical protein